MAYIVVAYVVMAYIALAYAVLVCVYVADAVVASVMLVLCSYGQWLWSRHRLRHRSGRNGPTNIGDISLAS